MRAAAAEFSRPIALARVSARGASEEIEATPQECAALARRLGIPAIGSLNAALRIEPWRREGAKVTGRLEADIMQTCVVTLEDFAALMSEPVERYYLPSSMAEPSEMDDDTEVAANGIVDLGELVAETLALALDPYPRKPGAAFAPDNERAPGD